MNAIMHTEAQEVREVKLPADRLIAYYSEADGVVKASINCKLTRVQKGGHVLSLGEERVFEVVGHDKVKSIQKEDLDIDWFATSDRGLLDLMFFGLRYDPKEKTFIDDVLAFNVHDNPVTDPDNAYDLDSLHDYKTIVIRIYLAKGAGTHPDDGHD